MYPARNLLVDVDSTAKFQCESTSVWSEVRRIFDKRCRIDVDVRKHVKFQVTSTSIHLQI
jgi:hypothetical protein